MAEITINGESVEAEEGELLFEVITDQGIEVPHFCYHPELSLAGACRMCLVEIDGEVDISCTRRIEDGMEVVTDNEPVTEERRGVLEFMLINHPLDCPVCDKGGECPLQDYTMGYGPSQSRFHGNKRTFPKFELGELLTQRQNRCILCYRCTRFYQEEGGREDFRVIQRGNDAFVGKQPGGQLESELSGNMVDICPTGTIVTKPYLHKSRPWEQEPVESVSAMDTIQTPIVADVRGDEIMRIRPQENPDFPKPWIDDKVRFVHEYNDDDEERVTLPVNDKYFDRLDKLRDGFKGMDPDRVGGIISPDRTLEEQFHFREFIKDDLGSDNVATYPDVGGTRVPPINFEELLESDFILVAGTNFRHQYPMLTPFLRTAARNGTEIGYLSYWGEKLTIEPDVYMRERPDELQERIQRLIDGDSADATDEALLESIREAEDPCVVSCEGRTLGRELTSSLMQLDGVSDYMRLSPGGNSKVSELVFESPQDTEEILRQTREGSITHLFVYGMDLRREFPDSSLVSEAIENVDFLAVADYLESDLTEEADVALPLTTQFEEEGVLINAEGRIRRRPVVTEHDERILPGWRMFSFLLYEEEGGAAYEPQDLVDRITEELEMVPEIDNEKILEESDWIEDYDPVSGDFSFEHESSDDWVLFSEPYLFSGDRRAQLGESIDGMIQESNLECNDSNASELGANTNTEIQFQTNGHAMTRTIEITNEPPEGSLMIPWNGPGDDHLDIYHGSKTFGTVNVAEPDVEG